MDGLTVYSAGYEGKACASLLLALYDRGVRTLVDVRANAVSRRREFCKKALAAECERHGITYLHIPELGTPRSLRHRFGAEEVGSSSFIRAYQREVLRPNRDDLDRLVSALRVQPSCVLCVEEDPRCCHRSVLLQQVNEMLGGEVNVHHI